MCYTQGEGELREADKAETPSGLRARWDLRLVVKRCKTGIRPLTCHAAGHYRLQGGSASGRVLKALFHKFRESSERLILRRITAWHGELYSCPSGL